MYLSDKPVHDERFKHYGCGQLTDDNLAHMEALLQAWGLDKEYFVKPADEHTLQIDIDSQEVDWERFEKRFHWLQKHLSIVSVRKTRSKSGNWHVHIELLEAYNAPARIAMQMFLGSDMHREFANLLGVFRNTNAPIALVEKKEEWQQS